MERNVKKGGRGRREGPWRVTRFWSFTRCSRRGLLCAYSELDDDRDGVRVLRALQCLRRGLFTYVTSKNKFSLFYAFRSAIFGLSFFYAN